MKDSSERYIIYARFSILTAHRLITKWMTLEKQLQEVGIDTDTTSIERDKDKVLRKLGAQPNRNDDQPSESLDFAQSTSQRIAETKVIMDNLADAMEAHDAQRKAKKEEHKAQKKRRLEQPPQDPIDEIKAAEEKIAALDNSLAIHAGDKRMQLAHAMDDLDISGPPMSSKQIAMKAQIRELQEGMANARVEMNEIASQYAVVIGGQKDVEKRIRLVQTQNEELKQDFEQVNELLSQSENFSVSDSSITSTEAGRDSYTRRCSR